MKNDKICINKSVMFISVVLVTLVGVVMATNYVNNQKLSTKSRAGYDNAVTPMPGSAVVMSSFKLSELKARAQEILKIKSSQLDATAMQKMQNALSGAQATADKALADTSSLSKRLALNVDTRLDKLNTDLTQTGTLITNLKADLAVSEKDVTDAEADYKTKVAAKDVTSKEVARLDGLSTAAAEKYGKAVQDLTNLKDQVATMRKQADGMIDDVLGSTSITTDPSWDPNFETRLTNIKSPLIDHESYINGINTMLGDISSAGIADSKLDNLKNIATKMSDALAKQVPLQANLDPLNKEMIDAKTALNKAKQADDVAKGAMDAATKVLNDAKAKQDTAKQKVDEAVAQKNTIDGMVVSLNSFKTDLSDFTNRLSESSLLPPQLQALTVPVSSNGVDVTSISDTNADIVNVNTTLLATSTAYDAFDKAIGGGKAEVRTQLQNYGDYCSKVDGYPIVDSNGLPAAFAEKFYNNPPPLGGNCVANEKDPAWNGYFGAKAKCYTGTGMCSTTEGATDLDKIIGRDVGKACIYREVDMNKCLDKFPEALKQQFTANSSLTCTGGKYFQIDGVYYKTGAEEVFDDSNFKYCVNKRIDPADKAAVTQAQAGVAQGLVDAVAAKNQECNKNGVFQSMPNDPNNPITYNMSPMWGDPAKKVVVSHVCYQVGGGASANGSYCMNKLLPDSKLCQCSKAGEKISFDGTLYTCSL